MPDHLLDNRHQTDPASVLAPSPTSETATRDHDAELAPTTPAPGPSPARELAARESDGIRVRLLWHPGDRAVWVSVADRRTGDRFDVAIPPEQALHAFHHPFVYAA